MPVAEVGNLTYREFSVMMEMHNDRLKTNYEMDRNVIFNAIINANRKKNSRVIPLFVEDDDREPFEIMEERAELFGNNS